MVSEGNCLMIHINYLDASIVSYIIVPSANWRTLVLYCINDLLPVIENACLQNKVLYTELRLYPAMYPAANDV